MIIKQNHSQRRINGESLIRGICIQDDINIEIRIANSLLNDKNLIKQMLIQEHSEFLRLYKKGEPISVGEIL